MMKLRKSPRQQLRKPPVRRIFDPEEGCFVLEADITDLTQAELDAWLKETFPNDPDC